MPSRPDAPGEAAVLEEVVGIHELCARPNGCAFCVAELARYVVAQAL